MAKNAKKSRSGVLNTLRAAALAGGAAVVGMTSTGCASTMNAGSQITTNLVHAERNRRNHGRDLFALAGDLITMPFAEENVMIEPAARDVYQSLKAEQEQVAALQRQNKISDETLKTYLMTVHASKSARDYAALTQARRSLLRMEQAQPALRTIRSVAEAGLAERQVILNQLPAADRARVLKQVDELRAAEQKQASVLVLAGKKAERA